MKKIVLAFSLLISLSFSAQELEVLKAKKEVLNLNVDLIEKKIDLLKEQQNNEKLKLKASELDKISSESASNKTAEANTEEQTKEAKKLAKQLKQSESANKNLTRSNDRIIDLEGDIKKIELKLERLKYEVEVKEK